MNHDPVSRLSDQFVYCRERLHLSEHAAFNRIEAARACPTFPVLLERLAEGALTLTAIRLLRPVLTEANHCDVVEQARHMGKQQVLELIARLRPQPPVPSTVRKRPAPRAAAADPESALPIRSDAEGKPVATCAIPLRTTKPSVVAPSRPSTIGFK